MVLDKACALLLLVFGRATHLRFQQPSLHQREYGPVQVVVGKTEILFLIITVLS
jgi:hypothetical protein